MALHSLIRKMPALGLRAPPMGSLMGQGPVRALAPAAGSRFMSSHSVEDEELVIQERLAQSRKESNIQFYRELAERTEKTRQFAELVRADIEDDERTRKKLKILRLTSNAVLILSLPTALYIFNYF